MATTAEATITLPVSLGEALDKLTILEIKMSKIGDERRTDVEVEYGSLLALLHTHQIKHAYYYRLLKESNRTIWDLQESFHGAAEPSAEVCSKILKENDRRFRIKKKINHSVNSALKEQKGYAKKKALVFGHLGMGDMIWMNGAVRYLATEFDEVVVICKRANAANVTTMYRDDPTIILFFIPSDEDLYPWWVIDNSGVPIRRVTDNYTFFECGQHAMKPVYNLPESFYVDMQIPYEYAKSFFYIERTQASKDLAAFFKNIPYILIHENASSVSTNIFKHVMDRGMIVLDICKNHYPSGHIWHSLAEMVVKRPLLDYMDLLEGARELHLIESSLFCLACHLDLSRVAVRKSYMGFMEGAAFRTRGLFTDGVAEPAPAPA
jgi:hypothetical protein